MADPIGDKIDKAMEEARHWWAMEDKDDAAGQLVAEHSTLVQSQHYRHQANLRHLRFYSQKLYLSLTASGYIGIPAYTQVETGERMKYNLVSAVVDTLTAKVAKNKPFPLFLTERGSFSQWRRAKKLTRLVNGVIAENKAYAEVRKTGVDAFIFGSGLTFVYRNRKDRIRVERAFTDEFQVDDWEARWGEPRTLYRFKAYPRDVLLDNWGAEEPLRQKIKDAPSIESGSTSAGKDMVGVVEGWHLPTEDGKGGRHIIGMNEVALHAEEWTREGFPFAKYDYSPAQIGWFGQGLGERLSPLQTEINKVLLKIQEILHIHAHPTWFMHRESKIAKDQMNNDVDNIITYDGANPPTLHVPRPVPVQLYEQVDRLWAKGFEQEGVSEVMSQGRSPLGPNASGAALMAHNDIESERHVLRGQAWEEYYMDISRLILLEAEDISKEAREAAEHEGEGGEEEAEHPVKTASMGYTVKAEGRGGLEAISWEDVKLDQDSYTLKSFPTSSMPSTPAGKMARVDDLLQRGWIDADLGFDLMDFPDIEAGTSMARAASEVIYNVIDDLLDGKDPIPPDPYMNLELGIKRVSSALLHAMTMDTPEEILEGMRAWIDGAVELQAPPQPEQPAGQPPAGMEAAGAPGAAAMPPAEPMGAPPIEGMVGGVPETDLPM